MINRIRVAKPEEVKAIEATSDLQGCTVLALDTPEGTITAVVRTPVEVDPVRYPEDISDRWKAMFQRDVETVLAAQGVTHYYFNVHAANEQWRHVVETYGALAQSNEPEIRYKKVL